MATKIRNGVRVDMTAAEVAAADARRAVEQAEQAAWEAAARPLRPDQIERLLKKAGLTDADIAAERGRGA